MARTTVYNQIVDESKYKDVNDENKELLDEFIEYLNSIDRSQGTINGYISDIKICFIWALEHAKNKHFIDFTKRDFMKYQNFLLNTLNLSSNRIRRMRSALSSMSIFIENILDDDYPNFRNIVNKIEAPSKQTVREKTILDDEECQQLLDKLVEKKEYQKACVFALAWASGSRKSELLRFKVSYFVDENIKFGSLYKTPEKLKTKGRGKQGKLLHRYVLVNKFKPYFDLWIAEREKIGVPKDIDDLFVTKKGDGFEPIKITTLNSWAIIFSKQLNMDFYFHSMRHNFTTSLSKANVPANVIKEIVGWESVEMVAVYDDTDIDDKLEDFFGEGGIKQSKTTSLSEL